jgi:hypothetical protein
MLTIPTSELIGLLTDVLGFTPVIKDDPRRGVLIEWDGEALHASAYDVLSAGRSSWTPGEGLESTLTDTDAPVSTETFGGEDSAWKAFVTFDDVKAITTTFKVASKLWWIPLSVKISPVGRELTVERSGEFGKPAALVTVRVDRDVTYKFPDVHRAWRVLQNAEAENPIGSVSFSPYRLAAFGTVRSHGVLDLEFAGEQGAVSASMGSRFCGFIFPAGARKAEASAILNVAGDYHGSDLLHYGSGLHVGGTVGIGKSTVTEQDQRYGGPAGDASLSTDPESADWASSPE